MDTLIALFFASGLAAACGFLYGLWWSRKVLEEARDSLDDALETLEMARDTFRNAIATFDDTQDVREKVEKATGVTIVPVRGRIS